MAEMRLIRGVSTPGRKLLRPVLFAPQLFRAYAVRSIICFQLSYRSENFLSDPAKSIPPRNPASRRTLETREPDRPGPAGHRFDRPLRLPATGTGRAKAMGFFSKDIKTLDDLFVHTLRDIYYAEKQIEKALPKMIDKATDAESESRLRKAPRGNQGPYRARRAGVRDARRQGQGGQLPGHRRHP